MGPSVARYTGLAQYGPAYQYMLERDTHAPGSVDRALVAQAVRLCADTADHLYSAHTPEAVPDLRGTRPALERHLAAIAPPTAPAEAAISAIAAFARDLSCGAPQDLDDMVFGGTEEQIIARKSEWCTDVARVACVLCQLAGLPARIVHLYNLQAAYSGHVIIEAFRGGGWGAVDSSTATVYTRPDGAPATTWDLMRNPAWVSGQDGFYCDPGQFSAAAIANYYAWKKYDYATSTLNAYCRSILEMADQGWPGGLRWLHGEDG